MSVCMYVCLYLCMYPCLSPIYPLEPFEKRSDLVGALGGYGGRDP